MAGIAGIGSGIDVDTFVQTMLKAQRAPKDAQLARMEKTNSDQISAIGTLKSSISTFLDALKGLTDSKKFGGLKATSSDSARVAASLNDSGTAVKGSYSLQVDQLAQGSKVALGTVQANQKFAEGTLKISVGSGDDAKTLDVEIDSSKNSLAGVRDAINEAGKDKGVTATIITDKEGSRLVLNSSKMGDGNDVRVSVNQTGTVSDGMQSLNKLAFDGTAGTGDGDAKVLQKAQNAIFYVDGIKMTSNSNKVDNIEGLTLELKAVTEKDKPLTIGVNADTSGASTQVKAFVEAYNKFYVSAASLGKITQVAGSNPVVGALASDSTWRGIMSGVSSDLGAMVGVSGDRVRALADIGITTKQDGTLALDEGVLNDALDKDFQGVVNLFTGKDGIANRLTGRLTLYTQSGGVLEDRYNRLQDDKKDIAAQKEAQDKRMKEVEARLYKQFQAMDSLVSQLNSTASSLVNQINNISVAPKS